MLKSKVCGRGPAQGLSAQQAQGLLAPVPEGPWEFSCSVLGRGHSRSSGSSRTNGEGKREGHPLFLLIYSSKSTVQCPKMVQLAINLDGISFSSVFTLIPHNLRGAQTLWNHKEGVWSPGPPRTAATGCDFKSHPSPSSCKVCAQQILQEETCGVVTISMRL